MSFKSVWHRLFRLEHPRGRVSAHVAEEFRFHIETRIRQLVAAGMDERAARRETLRLFGNVRALKRETVQIASQRMRKEQRMEYLRSLWNDARFGLRSLGRSPVLAAVAILTLTLGIGLNVAFFGIVKGVVLDPLSYRDPDRLFLLYEVEPQLPRAPVTGPDFLDWSAQNTSFSDLGAFTIQQINTDTGDRPERTLAAPATAGLWRTLDVPALLGRAYTEQEEADGEDMVMISHRFWRSRFGGREDVVGRTLLINGTACTIVGVMPRDFWFPLPWRSSQAPEIWTPLKVTPENPGRGSHWLLVIGRLKAGVEAARAGSELRTIAAAIEQAHPETNTGMGAAVVPVREQLLGAVSRDYGLLLAAVGLVLLIACANIAGLLAARTSSRSTELAVRSILGAGRMRLVRQILTESLTMAVVGGGLGLAAGLVGLQLLKGLIPADVPRAAGIGFDAGLFLFTLAATLLTGILAGLVPALSVGRRGLERHLRQSRRGASGAHSAGRFRDLLLVVQFALALLLADTGTLMVLSYLNVHRVEPGVEPGHVLTAGIGLTGTGWDSEESINSFWDRLIEGLEGWGGVIRASFTSKLPLEGGINGTVIVEGKSWSEDQWEGPLIETSSVLPGYFETMGITLAAGRCLDREDADQGSPGAVINEETALRLWPDQDPVGRRFSYNRTQPYWITVVGVVRNVRQFGLEQESSPEIYLHEHLAVRDSGFLVVRTSGDPLAFTTALRTVVRGIDATIPVDNIRSMAQIVDSSLARRRFNTLLINIFALMALILVTGGIYGVMAFFVTQRHHEIGVRMALGATTGEVYRSVVARGLRLATIGLVLGLLGTILTSGLVAHLLFGVTPLAPLPIAGVFALLLGVAAIASGIPARRATRVDPVRVLGSD